jgi:Pseudouridylate synthases, 23S RNA-specific
MMTKRKRTSSTTAAAIATPTPANVVDDHNDCVCCSFENYYVVSLEKDGTRMNIHMPTAGSSSSSSSTNSNSTTTSRTKTASIIPTVTATTTTTDNKNKDDGIRIPETVIQYERQLRKTQAASRASTPLCKTQLHILHNDESVVVVNKPSGVLTVPGIHSNPSILTMLYDKFQHEMESTMKREHMIVHRLDMDTSGIVVFAKTREAMSKLQSNFREKKVSKYYEALLCGHIHANVQEGIINLPLQKDHRYPPFMRVATPQSEQAAKQVVQDLNHAGWKKIIKKNPKPSETRFQVIGREYVVTATSSTSFSHSHDHHQDHAVVLGAAAGGQLQEYRYPVTRVRLIPVTGRTHQLRVHCAAIGHPILGDPAYGIFGEAARNGGFEDENVMDRLVESTSRATVDLQLSLDKYVKEQGLVMCLHARELRFLHPRSGEEMCFVQPPDF